MKTARRQTRACGQCAVGAPAGTEVIFGETAVGDDLRHRVVSS
jgi:hypothetical protein